MEDYHNSANGTAAFSNKFKKTNYFDKLHHCEKIKKLSIKSGVKLNGYKLN